MRRPRRRPMHYTAQTLYDGTIIAAYPIRKPVPKIIKRDNLKIDEDGITNDLMDAGKHISDWQNETRFRFQNILANRLNTRRAIRELVLPELSEVRDQVASMKEQLDRIESIL